MTDFYQTHYLDYHERTFQLDSSIFLEPFVAHLAPGCRILDAGCGSGRDLLWLMRHGFEVVGLERAPGLADLARRHAGCEVVTADFEVDDLSGFNVDAVLMAGSLVHVPPSRIAGVIDNVTRALGRPQNATSEHRNMLYLSLKQGQGTRTDASGRVFFLWSDQTLRDCFARRGWEIRAFCRTPSATGSDDIWLGYVLALP
jgi:SAM-dependent methyltransferase